MPPARQMVLGRPHGERRVPVLVDGDLSEGAQRRSDDGALEQVAAREERHLPARSGRGEHHEREVDVADMVARDDGRPRCRQVLEPFDAQVEAGGAEADLEQARDRRVDRAHQPPERSTADATAGRATRHLTLAGADLTSSAPLGP